MKASEANKTAKQAISNTVNNRLPSYNFIIADIETFAEKGFFSAHYRFRPFELPRVLKYAAKLEKLGYNVEHKCWTSGWSFDVYWLDNTLTHDRVMA